ncbi:MAG: helix-turn-helix transcriptional regulator [Actinomycetota bacterium]|nr:helix-turn-helix transcriptional regulator [Actinomycetota bacterium]
MHSRDEHGRTPRTTLVVAAGAFGLVRVEAITGLGGAVAKEMSVAEIRDTFVRTDTAIALSCATAGVLIAWQRPRNPVGWLLIAAGAFQGGTAAGVPFLIPHTDLAVAGLAQRTTATLVAYCWPWSIALCLPLALLLFPDGTLLSRRWRVAASAVALESVVFAVEVGSDPTSFPGAPRPWLAVPDYPELSWLWTGSELTNRELQVLALLADGLPTTAIATKLGLAPKTNHQQPHLSDLRQAPGTRPGRGRPAGSPRRTRPAARSVAHPRQAG